MDYIPLPEAARRLGLSSMAVRKRCQRGTLPSVKRGDAWYVAVDAAGQQDGPARPETDRPAARTRQDTGQATRDEGAALALAREQLAVKDHQIEAMQRQIAELHVLLRQAQALPAATETSAVNDSAAPAPAARRRWWPWRR